MKNKSDKFKKLLESDEAFEKYRINFVKKVLRSASLRWFCRNEAIKNGRVDRGLYTCKNCNIVGARDKFQLDHIEEVDDPKTGWVNFDTYVSRLLCKPELFQLVCLNCHEIKTQISQELRKKYRNNKKKIVKSRKK